MRGHGAEGRLDMSSKRRAPRAKIQQSDGATLALAAIKMPGRCGDKSPQTPVRPVGLYSNPAAGYLTQQEFKV